MGFLSDFSVCGFEIRCHGGNRLMLPLKKDIRFRKDLAVFRLKGTLLGQVIQYLGAYDLALVLGLTEDHGTEALFEFLADLRVKERRINTGRKIGNDRIVLIEELHLIVPERIGSV